MAEYIERESAIDVINKLRGPTRSPAQNDLIRTAKMGIERIPAADVDPVRHGQRMEAKCQEIFLGYECSALGCLRISRSKGRHCPYCGAKIGLEAENG